MMCEQWRPVVGHEGSYEVSSLGRVRSLDRWIVFECKSAHSNAISIVRRPIRGRIMKLQRDGDGYLYLTIGGTKCYVHRLVLGAFVGPPPPGTESLHENNDKGDASLFNLSWGTRSQNLTHAYKTGAKKPIYGPAIATKAWATKRRRAAEATS